ncbi:MAG: glycerophosphodiester phosphodiesterase [Chthoniobacterales bacterium]
MVECDIRLTSDGEIVVFHDATLERLTSHSSKLSDFSFADLRANVRLRGADGKPGDECIPSFSEFLSVLSAQSKSAVGLFVEIKESAPCLLERLVEMLRDFPPALPLTLGSFLPEVTDFLIAHKNQLPDQTQLLVLFEKLDHDVSELRKMRQNGITLLGLDQSLLSNKDVQSAHEAGLKVWAWTANSEDDLRRMVAIGVDGIISDNPAVTRKIVDKAFAG